jgi:hypothetical protein
MFRKDPRVTDTAITERVLKQSASGHFAVQTASRSRRIKLQIPDVFSSKCKQSTLLSKKRSQIALKNAAVAPVCALFLL